jgi:phage shock protein A
MKAQAVLQELESAAETLSVKVTYEALNASVGHGGLCRVKGQYRVIVEKRASVHERAATLAQALAQLDTSSLTLSPKVRQLVTHYSAMLARMSARPPQQKAS